MRCLVSRSWLAALLLLAGCGRFGFESVGLVSDAAVDPTDATSDAEPDAEIEAGVPPPVARNWYRFEGTGTDIIDEMGGANGTLVGGGTLASGLLSLSGTDQYVNLPNGMISSLTSATVEVWIVWDGGPGAWQRIFDFGNSSGGEDVQGNGTRSFSLTVNGAGTLRLLFDVNPALDSTGWNAFWVYDVMSAGEQHQLVATFDEAASPSVMSLYLDGALLAVRDVPDDQRLSQIDDVNCWLGRAQWSADAELDGTYLDLRIYDVALDAEQVLGRYTRGPDVP